MQDQSIVPSSKLPSVVIEEAKQQAKALKDLVDHAHLSIKIGNHDYLMFEAWQTAGWFKRITAAVGWTKPIHNRANDIIGYEARAEVFQDGQMISAAEAQCTVEEAKWKNRELWQLRSMAQTRACAKALRNVLAWVVVLAGYSATPAEEMNHGQPPYKPNWRKFRQDLTDLGVEEEKAKEYLGVSSIKDEWLGKQKRTLDEAISYIKAKLAEKAAGQE